MEVKEKSETNVIMGGMLVKNFWMSVVLTGVVFGCHCGQINYSAQRRRREEESEKEGYLTGMPNAMYYADLQWKCYLATEGFAACTSHFVTTRVNDDAIIIIVGGRFWFVCRVRLAR